MSKNTTTISYSTPPTLAEEIDKLANELNVNRSSLLTAITTVAIKWIKSNKDLSLELLTKGE